MIKRTWIYFKIKRFEVGLRFENWWTTRLVHLGNWATLYRRRKGYGSQQHIEQRYRMSTRSWRR